MLIPILIALLIFALVVWVIGILPLPTSPFPVKTILYVVATIILILYLLGYV